MWNHWNYLWDNDDEYAPGVLVYEPKIVAREKKVDGKPVLNVEYYNEHAVLSVTFAVKYGNGRKVVRMPDSENNWVPAGNNQPEALAKALDFASSDLVFREGAVNRHIADFHRKMVVQLLERNHKSYGVQLTYKDQVVSWTPWREYTYHSEWYDPAVLKLLVSYIQKLREKHGWSRT